MKLKIKKKVSDYNLLSITYFEIYLKQIRVLITIYIISVNIPMFYFSSYKKFFKMIRHIFILIRNNHYFVSLNHFVYF